jgi:hypothetical protein
MKQEDTLKRLTVPIEASDFPRRAPFLTDLPLSHTGHRPHPLDNVR